MLSLKPLAATMDCAGVKPLVPRELLALSTAKAPWTSYIAFNGGGAAVGACAFKNAPDKKKEVEIAYLTFPGHARRGHGTAMARALINIAAGSGAVDHVVAQTLPGLNASVRICRRLGFAFAGEVIDPHDGKVWRWRKPTGRTLRVLGRSSRHRKPGGSEPI